ncbi:TPA: hypothetical protein ACGXER_000978 [Pseudomonas aeruginosa]|nr:hypothetical protein [Pseudomonas aeruginosa]
MKKKLFIAISFCAGVAFSSISYSAAPLNNYCEGSTFSAYYTPTAYFENYNEENAKIRVSFSDNTTYQLHLKKDEFNDELKKAKFNSLRDILRVAYLAMEPIDLCIVEENINGAAFSSP